MKGIPEGPVAAGAFLLYAATACPTVPFGDAGELVAAADCLGVAHPPGYPVWTALGRLALVLLPVGEPAYRVALLSALLAAGAAGLLVYWVRKATGSAWGGAAAGTALALSNTFWDVATVAEVYSFHVLLMIALLAAAWGATHAGAPERRAWSAFGAGAALGLGLAHHPTIVLALPAAAVLAWPGRGRLERRHALRAWAIAFGIAAMIPVAAYVWLLLRSRGGPPSNWGNPSTLAALWTHATAHQYRFYDMGWAGLARPEAWGRGLLFLARDGGFVTALAALFGLTASRRRVAPWVLLFGASVLFALRYGVADVEPYYLPAIVALAGLAGEGVARLRGRAKPAAAVALVAVSCLALHGRERNRRGLDSAILYGRDLLATLPQGATLVGDGDDLFLVAYLNRVLGERRDVTVLDRDDQVYPSADGAFEKVSGPLFFMTVPSFALPPGTVLEPFGLLFRVERGGAAPADDASVWASYHEEELRRQAARYDEPWARTLAAWYPLMRGRRALFEGDRARGLELLQDAARLAPEEEPIRNTLGAVYGTLGDYRRAVREFEIAVKARPMSLRAWANLARARSLAGDPLGAAAAQRVVDRLAPPQRR